jgi:hypothetical protein
MIAIGVVGHSTIDISISYIHKKMNDSRHNPATTEMYLFY